MSLPDTNTQEAAVAAWRKVKAASRQLDPFNSGVHFDHPTRTKDEGSDEVGERLLREAIDELGAVLGVSD